MKAALRHMWQPGIKSRENRDEVHSIPRTWILVQYYRILMYHKANQRPRVYNLVQSHFSKRA